MFGSLVEVKKPLELKELMKQEIQKMSIIYD